MLNDHAMILSAGLILLLLCNNSQGKGLRNSTANTSNINDKEQKLNSRQLYVKGNCSNYLEEKEYVLLENDSNDTSILCFDETEHTLELTTEPQYNFSHEFLSCGHVLIEPVYYELLQNGSIYIDIYSRIYGPGDYFIKEYGVYVCVPKYEEMPINPKVAIKDRLNKFSESFVYVTYVGLMLSIISLVSHLAVFCVVSSVRNLPGCCLASLSLSLLMAYLCFLSVALVQNTHHCASLGMSVYYFFLTSFFWMNAIAFDVWRSFRVVVRELRISSHRVPWRRFLLYSLYSWLVPAALVAIVKIADSTDLLPQEFKPSFGAPICWFGSRKALLVFFALPLIIVMFLNGIFFLDVTYVISRATLKTSQSHEATLKKRFFMFMRLALIMGLTWVVGLLAGYIDQPFMWYLFVILNTLQGLFIFVVFSCSSKVRGLCCKRYRNNSKASTNTSVRTISAAV